MQSSIAIPRLLSFMYVALTETNFCYEISTPLHRASDYLPRYSLDAIERRLLYAAGAK